MSKYLYAGLNAGPLASGRWVEPGESLDANAVNPEDAHDAALLEDGSLVDTAAAKKAAADHAKQFPQPADEPVAADTEEQA